MGIRFWTSFSGIGGRLALKLLVTAMTHDRSYIAFFVNLDSKIGLSRKIIFSKKMFL